MTGYVDGFVLPVPKKNLGKYRHMAKGQGKTGKSTAHYNILDARVTTCIPNDRGPVPEDGKGQGQ